MQVYELGYLILPSIPEESLPDIVSKIKSNLISPLDSEDSIKVDLAYPMKKTVGSSNYVVNDAYLGWMKFEATAEEVEELKDKIEKVEEVLRFIIVKASRETKFTLAKAEETLSEAEEAVIAPVIE
ncbi:MAG TPA: 30S ribosomal protein S6 [Candidatus Paceibacterota bacterium]